MKTDIARALAVCSGYLANRPRVLGLLAVYVRDGVRAQDCEGSRSTGHAIIQDPDGARPTVSDPTGETASHPDDIRVLLDDIARAESRLVAAANRLIGHSLITSPTRAGQVLDHYRPTDDHTSRQIRDAAAVFGRAMAHTVDANTVPPAGQSADGAPGCGSCARLKTEGHPWWNDPGYNSGRPTDLAGLLDTKVKLCRTCYRFTIAQDPVRLPTRKELAHRRSDPRGRWPVRHA